MKIGTIGLGAIGAAYGDRIKEASGLDHYVILDEDRYKRYENSNFTVNGKKTTFNFISSDTPEIMDVIIVSVKYHNLLDAIDSMKGFVDENTTIFSLMNGIDSEEIIGQTFSPTQVVYGMCIGIDALRSGHDIQYSQLGTIFFGSNDGTRTTHTDKVLKTMEASNLVYQNPKDMVRRLWWKFMVNIGINQTSTVLLATYGNMRKSKEALALMHDAMFEVIALSQKIGVNLNEKDYEEWLGVLNTLMTDGKTSMLQDMEAGRKTEVEMLAGTLIRLGKKHGVKTPVNDMYFRIIKAREAIT